MRSEFRRSPSLIVRFRHTAPGQRRFGGRRTWMTTRRARGGHYLGTRGSLPPIITLGRRESPESRLDNVAGHAGLALILTFAVSLLFPEDPRAVIEGSILGFVGLLFCLAGVIAGSGRRCGLLGLIAAAIAVGLHAIFATAA